MKYFLTENKLSVFSVVMIYGITYIKYTNNIPAQLFCYLLLYMKPDNISIFISGITDILLYKESHSLYHKK